MADRRPENGDGARVKRQKMADLDPRDNPYLAHMYDNDSASANGYHEPQHWVDDPPNSPMLANFKRHKTTAAMAREAEDSKFNPFNGKPVSSKYFSILKTRRDLPVHAQRYVL
jgi:pre-mRNA-splicing factor ATP-dependent RNA helicase DHX15/PRP43